MAQVFRTFSYVDKDLKAQGPSQRLLEAVVIERERQNVVFDLGGEGWSRSHIPERSALSKLSSSVLGATIGYFYAKNYKDSCSICL